ncbi:hypothetical protein ACFLR3_00810 [Campylobacterota bacterium]
MTSRITLLFVLLGAWGIALTNYSEALFALGPLFMLFWFFQETLLWFFAVQEDKEPNHKEEQK